MSDRDPNRAENVRLAIASQPSVEQGIAALLRTVATHLQEAIETNDMSQLKALADHINADPRAWSDALLANTPAAPQTIAPTVAAMPVYVQDAFRDHSVLAHEAEQRDADSGGTDDGVQGESEAEAPPPASAPAAEARPEA